jgi:hypothetical protein
MVQPVITFRQNVSPYSVVSNPFVYSETIAKQSSLPVLMGDDSDVFFFRVYNNYALASNIATALNFIITTYDAGNVFTASTLAVSHQWVHVMQNGYGENSTPPGLYSIYQDVDTAVGGANSVYSPPVGSNGSTNSYIRAGSGGAGVGFIEVKTKVSIPLTDNAGMSTYNFGIVTQYDWSS